MAGRKRKIDIDKLSEKDIEDLQLQLGEKIREICDQACNKANKLLNTYGMQAKFQMVIVPKEAEKRLDAASQSLS